MEIDVSRINSSLSNTEISAHSNKYTTRRSLCANSPINKSILGKIISTYNKSNCSECSKDLFPNDPEGLEKLEELRNSLSELLMRFDTSPGYYTKEDYQYLMYILSFGLLHLYKTTENIESPIIEINGVPVQETGSTYNLTIAPSENIEIESGTGNTGIQVRAKSKKIEEVEEDDEDSLAIAQDVKLQVEIVKLYTDTQVEANKIIWEVE